MEPLIVCYSHSGNNRRLAARLKGRLRCELLHIDERRKRKTLSILLDFFFKRNVRLSDYRFTGRKHDVLVLVAPIWGGKLAAPMREFVGKERDNIHKYLLITLCNGVEGQKEKLEAELSSIVRKEPLGTTELWVNRLLPEDKRNKVKHTFNYRVDDSDLDRFEAELDAFVCLIDEARGSAR
ncbi:MAG: flavodoxin family protein [Sphaerochaetaceae bacterium]